MDFQLYFMNWAVHDCSNEKGRLWISYMNCNHKIISGQGESVEQDIDQISDILLIRDGLGQL